MRLDDSLHNIFAALPSLALGKKVRPSVASRRAAKRAFLAHGTLPVFDYPKTAKIDIPKTRQALAVAKQALTLDNSPAPLKHLYGQKLNEYETRLNLIHAVAQGDDKLVTKLSCDLYGQPAFALQDFEREFASRCHDLQTKRLHLHTRHIDAEKFAALVRQALERLGLQNAEIKFSTRTRVLCQRNLRSGKLVIRIPKKLLISKNRAHRLIAHELEIHALRRHNGAMSQLHILEHGTAGYINTEEGLALYHQTQRTPSSSHVPGFWDSWTITLMQHRGFNEAYQRIFTAKKLLLELAHSEKATSLATERAWDLCVRASRGITRPGKPGLVYVKDHIYRSGYQDVSRAFSGKHSDQLMTELYRGKIGLQDLDLIAPLNLEPMRSAK